MNKLKPLTQILLCAQFLQVGAAFAQEPMSMSGMDMPGMDMPASAPDANTKKTDTDSMKSMDDMPGMEHTHNEQPPVQPSPPVGSLPSSDGSAGKSYHVEGMNMAAMEMDDDPLIAKFMLDKLEYVHGDLTDSMAWDGRFRLGHDLDKLWIRSEGERAHGSTQSADAELLWGHTYAAYWDVVTGVRHDFGNGPSRDWAALGIQGLAPYKFDVEATAYAGPAGRAAMRLKTAYDLLLTQRLVLTPEIDANLYSKDDPDRGIGAGLSDTSLGLRLRYEIRRELAPYIGVNYVQKYGKTADIARTNNDSAHDLQLIAGVRIWF
ncbi:MAG: copper resistance protein B [Sulfuriferula sp.]|nr:copper resistance protein B [Sulfuriferula sp.]